VRKNETKINIACAHPSGLKTKWRKKIGDTEEKQVIMGR
jgi:hypothetical protein